MTTTDEDRRWMRRAIALAEQGWGRVHPNPLVGAIVVREGRVVGEGYHTAFGAPHAEVEALEGAGPEARGATAYVSLEPCCHHGKTPPCTDALIDAGVARVVFAAEDPTDAGGGAQRLQAAGIETVGGVEREAARRQNAAFFHAAERQRPWVALKYALSLDGGLAARAGERTDLTGVEAREDAHRLRAGFDAIMVGSATARIDDPLLTVRGAVEPIRPPVRVVADSGAGLAPSARLLRTVAEAGVVVLAGEHAAADRVAALETAGARVLRIPETAGGLDVAAALDALWRTGVRSILCEGGARLGASLLEAGLVNRLYLYLAPRVLGREAVRAFTGGPVAGKGRVVETARLGDDVRVVIDLNDSGAATGDAGAA